MIRSVSIPRDLYLFAKNNSISLSAVLISALKNKELEKNGELLENNAVLRQRLETLSSNLQKAMSIIEKKGATNEFLEIEN